MLANANEAKKDEFTREDGVVVLGDDNLGRAQVQFPFLVVEFYAPWCGHCNVFAPEYSAAAQDQRLTEAGVVLAKVDATANPKAAEDFQVSGYPTVIFLREGTIIPYNGARNAEELVSWLLHKQNPALHIETAKDANETISAVYAEEDAGDYKALVLAYFPSSSLTTTSKNSPTSPSLSTFLNISSENSVSYCYFAFTSVPTALSSYGVDESKEALIVFRNYDTSPVLYEGDFSHQSIKAFLNVVQYPMFVPFGEAPAEIFAGPIKDFAVVMYYGTAPADIEGYEAILHKFQGKLVGLYVEAGERDADDAEALLEFFSVSKPTTTVVRILRTEGEDLSVFNPQSPNDETSVELFEKFLNAHINGETIAEKVETGQPAHEEEVGEEDNASTVLNLKSLEALLESEDKEAFVKFYAPWCGHCKNMAPAWSKLATKYSNTPNLVIAKIDATVFPVEGVQGFPTIRWYPLGRSKADNFVEYEGERDVKSLSKFVEAHSHVLKASLTVQDSIISATKGFLETPSENALEALQTQLKTYLAESATRGHPVKQEL